MRKVNPKNVLLLICALLFSYAVGFGASILTQSTVDTWYQELNRPAWTPPDITFSIVWTILYGMIGFSFWLMLRNPKVSTRPLIPFFIQMFLNFTWPLMFFYLESPLLGLINILVLLLAIAWNMLAFCPYSKPAAALLLPYFLWVLYATTLNFGIWLMN